MPKIKTPSPGSTEWVQKALELLGSISSSPTKTDSTGVQIWEKESTPEPEDTLKPFVGTNKKAIFRKFGINTYNGPKKEDFFNFGNSYYKILESVNQKPLSPAQKELTEKTFKEFKEQIESIFSDLNSNSIINKDTDPKPIQKKIEEGGKALKQLITNFAFILTQDNDVKKLKKTAKKLREALKRDIAKTGRANSYHIYEIPNLKNPNAAPIQRISISSTIGEATHPSSIRDTSNPKVPLSNFIRRTFGSVKKDKDGKPVVKIDFSAITHSSYPPVDLFSQSFNRKTGKFEKRSSIAKRFTQVPFETEIKIRETAITGVESVLQELARKAIAEGKSEPGKPIQINLTTLSLLTPIVKETIERLYRPGVSESKQLKEVMLALSMCRGRKIEVKDENGEPLTSKDEHGNSIPIILQADISHLNAPVNLGTWKKRYASAETNTSHQYTNTRGFYDYCRNVNTFLDPENQFATASSETDKFYNIKKFLLYVPIEHNLATESDREHAYRIKIDETYQELYKLQIILQDSHTSSDERNSKEKEYKNLLKEIETLEAAHQKICAKLIEGQRLAFEKVQETAETELMHLEAKMIEMRLNSDPTYNEKDQDFIDTCRLIFDTKKLYLSGDYRKAENAYELQSRYLLSNARMGRNAEYFCKSAEDRSGRLGEFIEEALAFKDEEGRFPLPDDLGDDKEQIQKGISPLVHNSSVNKQVTDDNDPGGRAEQVGSKFNGQHLHLTDIDKTMSVLPKHIIKIGSVTPSPWLVQELKVAVAQPVPLSSSSTQAEKLNFLTGQLAEKPDLYDDNKSATLQRPFTLDVLKSEMHKWKQYEGYQLLDPKEEKLKNEKLKALEDLYQKLNQPGKGLLEDRKSLELAQTAVNTLKQILPTAREVGSEFRHLWQAKSIKKIKKLSSTKNLNGYLELSKHSIEILKDRSKDQALKKLYEGVLYKMEETKSANGKMEILIPQEGSISRVYNAAEKKAEISLNASSERAILIALESSIPFAPLTLEIPKIGGRTATSQEINEKDLDFAFTMLHIAQVKGIAINLDPQYKKIIEGKYPGQTFEQIKNNFIENKKFDSNITPPAGAGIIRPPPKL